MKTRTSFVTNSSSCSYVVSVVQFDKSKLTPSLFGDLKKLVEKNWDIELDDFGCKHTVWIGMDECAVEVTKEYDNDEYFVIDTRFDAETDYYGDIINQDENEVECRRTNRKEYKTITEFLDKHGIEYHVDESYVWSGYDG